MKTASLSLAQAIDFYLSTRRSLGFALKPNEQLLRSLARYAKKVHHRGPLTEQLALDWVRLPASANAGWWARRLGIVHRFARFWHEFNPRVQVPPLGVFGPEGRRGPVHRYTQNEIGSLLAAALALPPIASLRPATFYTLLGLLACTGLRISEALHLLIGDFDPATGTLTIRRSKGGRSRYVPLQPSVVARLQAYQRLRHQRHPLAKTTAFFLSDTGQPLSYRQAARGFRFLRKQLGWTQSPIPRLHDLRHTFAVDRLISWQRRGEAQVEQKILALATYLGHRNIRHTYWYLSAVPELLVLASKRLGNLSAAEGKL
jgi:integrase